jgi:hypothetical protein
MMATLTAYERRRYAIARSRERRAAELAPRLAEVDRLVSEVGWSRARPVVREVLGPHVLVSRPAGRWRAKVGKRAGARIVAAVSALPAQQTLPLSQPSRNVNPKGDHP